MKRVTAIAALLLVGFLGDGFATIPQTINFQGVLTDGGGTVMEDGTYQVTFRLYEVPSGGSHLWEETHGAVNVTKGIFNVMLGSVVSFGLAFDTQYFLGISVEGGAELEPRVYLSSNAYSLGARGLYGDSNVMPADGSVGIGTLIPGDPLTVQSDDAVGIRFRGYATAWAGIYAEAMQPGGRPQFGYSRSGLKATTYVDTNDYFRLFMNGSDRVTVKPDGYVGIGQSEPSEKLDVAGGLKIGATSNENAGTIRFSGGDFEGYNGSSWQSLTGAGITGMPAGDTGQTLYHTGSYWVGTWNLYNSGSSIGIGTTNPMAPLDILGGNGDFSSTDGDLKIGDSLYKLKLGVSTDGPDAGTGRVRMEGGAKRLVLGAGTTDVLAIEADGTTKIGSDAQTGRVYIYGNGITEPVVRAFPTTDGGSLYLYDEGYHAMGGFAPDQSSGEVGGFFFMARNETETGFIIDGNYAGYDEPSVGIHGSVRSAVFNMYNTGNSSVALPQDAISSYEIYDEPGGASYTEGFAAVTITSDYTTIGSQSIQAPANGYVLVIASCQGQFNHVSGTTTSFTFGVSDTYGSFPENQDLLFQLPSTAASGIYSYPITCSGFFEVLTGVHTFRFIGRQGSGAGSAIDVQLTAVFIPSAYGTVEPTAVKGYGVDGDRELVITEADVVSQRAASEAANLARLEKELLEIRATVEEMKAESERQIREASRE
jgi:hypothetical protein